MDYRILVGIDEPSERVLREDLPGHFADVLECRYGVDPDRMPYGKKDWRFINQVIAWSSDDPCPPHRPSPYIEYDSSTPYQAGLVDFSELADQLPPGVWPESADALFASLANRYRGFAPFVFSVVVSDTHPELEAVCLELLRDHIDEITQDMGRPYVEPSVAHLATACIAFGRARRLIRWEKFPQRRCPLCGLKTYPNRQNGWGIVERQYPPRWCHVCAESWSMTPPLIPTFEQASNAVHYYIKATGFVPKMGGHSLANLPPEHADKVLAAAMSVPTDEALRHADLNPWSKFISEVGVLGDVIRTARGSKSKAIDGHWTLSLFERAIDDFMTTNRIDHEHEPSWPVHPRYNPTGRRRADWLLADGTMVEAAGMLDSPQYAAKIEDKKRLADALGITLVILEPGDVSRLDEVLLPWIPVI